MGKDNKVKSKEKSFFEQVASAFTASKTSRADLPKNEGEETLAEKINWGGRYPENKSKTKPKK